MFFVFSRPSPYEVSRLRPSDSALFRQKKSDSLKLNCSFFEFGRAGPENTLLLAITCERVRSSHYINNNIICSEVHFISKCFVVNILSVKTYLFRLNAGYKTNQGPSENFQALLLWCGSSIRRSSPSCCSCSFGRWFLVHIEYHRCEELMLTSF